MCGFRFTERGHRDQQCVGGITLSLPESASFEIVADCHSGDIDSEFQADSLKLTPGTGSKDAHLEGKYGTGRGPKII